MSRSDKKLIEEIVKKTLTAKNQLQSGAVIQGCNFTGVQFDAKAVDAIQQIAHK